MTLFNVKYLLALYDSEIAFTGEGIEKLLDEITSLRDLFTPEQRKQLELLGYL